jgi:hypothetical protein
MATVGWPLWRFPLLLSAYCLLILVAHTGLEPVISALRGQRVNQLHQCAAVDLEIIEGADTTRQVDLKANC